MLLVIIVGLGAHLGGVLAAMADGDVEPYYGLMPLPEKNLPLQTDPRASASPELFGIGYSKCPAVRTALEPLGG